jgi:DGQHR domain-containing protein
VNSRISIPAISCHQWMIEWDNYPFPADHQRQKPPENIIVFSVPARLLRRLAGVYVRKREAGAATGIQRTHEKDRSEKIREYVKAGYPFGDLSKKQKANIENENLRKPGWLPTAIVVNILKQGDQRRGKQVADKDVIEVLDTGNGKTLEIKLPENVEELDWNPEGFSPIEVIDGQHRLFAFDESSGLPEDFELPVVAFHGLDMGWQAYLFWSINVSPKKINPSHAYDLFPLLRTQDWLEAAPSAHVYREARAQELTELLFRHARSPWRGRINMLGEKKTGWVSQAGWVQSIFNSFFSLGTTSRSRKGLFASNLSPSVGPLEWSRPQQAAFLMFLWKTLQQAVFSKKNGWAQTLREENGQQIDFDDNHDPVFTGSKTLLNQEQGIRGFALAMNDLFWAHALDLKLNNWFCDDIEGGETRDEDIDVCLNGIYEEPFAAPIQEVVTCLAEFDWRSYDLSLSTEEQQIKAGFRGTGGYSRIRLSLLQLISSQESALSVTAANLLSPKAG